MKRNTQRGSNSKKKQTPKKKVEDDYGTLKSEYIEEPTMKIQPMLSLTKEEARSIIDTKVENFDFSAFKDVRSDQF